MKNQIIQQTKGTNSLTHLKTGNKELLAISHFTEPNLSEVPEETIKTALRKVIVLLGLKHDSLPNDIQKAVILEFLKENYSNLTPTEIYKAFELALIGKLEVSATAYQNFNCEYISSILNAYSKYIQKNKIYTNYLDKQETPENADQRAELIRKSNEKFLQKKYKEFLSIVEQAVKKVNQGETISFCTDYRKANSFIAAITLYSDKIITPAQTKWIDKVLNNVDYKLKLEDFDNLETYESVKNSLKKRHESILVLELFLCSFVKDQTGKDPNKFFSFTKTYRKVK